MKWLIVLIAHSLEIYFVVIFSLKLGIKVGTVSLFFKKRHLLWYTGVEVYSEITIRIINKLSQTFDGR